MARYGTFKYSFEKYGASVNPNLLWAVEIDWDGNEFFDGSNEASNIIGLTINRGRRHYITPGGGQRSASGFEHMNVGKANITLVNDDGRYDPFNTSSPLFPNVAPGKYIKISVTDGIGGTKYNRFAGRIENIKQMRKNGRRIVKITATGGWRWLRDNDANIALQTDVITDDAIGQILDDVGWPAIWGRSLGTGADTIGYWGEDNRSASAAINDLNDSEVGIFFIAADGEAIFRGRHNLDTSVQTITQSQMLKDINIPQPWEVVRNVVRIVARPRIVQSGVELWRLHDIPLLAAGASISLFAGFLFENRTVWGQSLTTPIATTDYTANSQEDGGGSDLTGDITVVITSTFNESAKLTITNGGGSGAYITLLKLRGDAIDSPNRTILEDDNSGTAQARIFILDSIHQQNVSKADTFANYLGDLLSTVREFPVFMVENRASVQFALELLDRVTITITKLGIDADYRIGGIEESWLTENGQAVRTRFWTEPFADISNFWQFTTKIGETSIFAY